MSVTEMPTATGGLLASLLSDESFRPAEPRTLEECELPRSLVESLIMKQLLLVGNCSGRALAEQICLPFGILENVFQTLRTRQILAHTGSAPLGDYNYTLTEQGRDRATRAMTACAYMGAAPVPLDDYVVSVEAQTIRAEAPKRDQLEEAFQDIMVNRELFDMLGPAVNSGAGLFLYGEPGNGKTTLAQRITKCFGHEIWIPQTIIEDGQLIKLYDSAYHEIQVSTDSSILKTDEYDRRWIKIRRPTVIVGGERRGGPEVQIFYIPQWQPPVEA
ncbi:MAG: AAA family ATPase, partial [Planctomycetes bacterium]|nr:AAA family ATPase [Planctomycetota bacterium]